MTALRASDGDHRDNSEIVDAMRDLSYSSKKDQHELFNRVVSSVMLGNTDDHLRNHGFLAERGWWTLSPAFDVNPTPDPWRMRATSIMGGDTLPDEAAVLLSFAEECGLQIEQARERIRAIAAAFAGWKENASANGIRKREIAVMSESIDTRVNAVLSAAAR